MYIKIGPVFLQVKKEYEQEELPAISYVITDWVGNLNNISSRKYNIGKGKKFIVVGYFTHRDRQEISKDEFNSALDLELHNYKEQFRSGDTFNIYFKKTRERIKLLKKYNTEEK